MAIKIGHSSKDESGKISGGVAGDQTGKEVCTRSWYNGKWDFVARPKRIEVAKAMVEACEQACSNPYVGYDQWSRNTLRAEARKVGYVLSMITTPCESDCSSLMGVCVEAAGINLPEGNLPTTRTLRRALEATGEFEILTDEKYLTSDKYLQAADILCREGSHTVMALEDGAKAHQATSTVPKVDAPTMYYSVRLPLLQKGCEGPAVKHMQELLLSHGEKLPNYGADSDFGTETGNALEAFQRKHNLEPNRKCGAESWTVLITT